MQEADGAGVSLPPGRQHVATLYPKDRRGNGRSILFISRLLPGRYEMACMCGAKAKRDANGDCEHMRGLRPLLKPWYRARMAARKP